MTPSKQIKPASLLHPVEIGEIPDDRDLLLLTAGEALDFFEEKAHRPGGLTLDSARPDSPCSIAAIGFDLTASIAAVSLGLMTRDEVRYRALEMVATLESLAMSGDADASGYRGFFYHFLGRNGRRTWTCELSSIDTALLMAGLLCAASYFDEESEDEHRIRTGAMALYERVDWQWMLREGGRLSHGWRPEARHRRRAGHERDGFLTCTWQGYNEGLLLQILALGSPTHPIGAEAYDAWCATQRLTEAWGQEYLHAAALFTHQFPQAWIDFRGLRDGWGREHGLDYFENSRRATLAQIEYARRNPRGFEGYSALTWGISASNGPGSEQKKRIQRDGRKLKFFGYHERGVSPPDGVPDDGTLAPWAAAAAVPLLPQECIAGMRAHREVMLCRPDWSGFVGSYNLAYVSEVCPQGWMDEHDLAIEQGPIVMMIANHLNGAIWELMRRSEPIRRGLRRAGFRGGWLDQ